VDLTLSCMVDLRNGPSPAMMGVRTTCGQGIRESDLCASLGARLCAHRKEAFSRQAGPLRRTAERRSPEMLSRRRNNTEKSPVWYARGLHFSCRQCGSCCTGPPGFVWVTEREREAIAEYLGISLHLLERQYCRRVMRHVSLREHENGDCFFLINRNCRIYRVRPRQCRTFPFWRDVLASPNAWEAAKRRCPGVGEGRLFTFADIQRLLQDNSSP